VRSYVE
jgi:hypothetical protein